jgi:hypothetical protein
MGEKRPLELLIIALCSTITIIYLFYHRYYCRHVYYKFTTATVAMTATAIPVAIVVALSLILSKSR